MKITLVTPPHYFLFSGTGVPRLAGFIKEKGNEVLQFDIDERVYSDLLTGENLSIIFSRIEHFQNRLSLGPGSLKLKEVINCLHPDIMKRFALPFQPEGFLKKILSLREQIAWEVHNSIKTFETLNLTGGRADFSNTMHLGELATSLFSLAHFPVSWGLLEGFQFRFSPTKVRDLLAVIQDENENPLIPYFREKIVPLIMEENPDLIGISLNHFSQFIPGFTLCRLLKKSSKSLPIILGGETLTEVVRFLPSHPDLFYLFDFIALGKGEYTLEGLTKTCPSVPEKIPNLVFVRKGKLLYSETREDVNIDTLPTPDFRVKKPNPIIPLSLSSGCVWGKCSFCFYPFTQTQGEYREHAVYQERSIAKVVEDIKKIHQEVSPLLFYFTDHSIPFKRLRDIGEGLRKAGISTHFFSFIRAEDEFASPENLSLLRQNGFIGGYFGLESGSQRINDLMNKGIKVKNVEKILQSFSDVGLIASLFCMIGFPGETEREAMKTVEFLRKKRHLITGDLSLGNFHLKFNTPVFREATRFGITRIWASEKEDFPLRYHYEVEEGLSEADTTQLIKKIYQEMKLKYLSYNLIEEILRRLVGE